MRRRNRPGAVSAGASFETIPEGRKYRMGRDVSRPMRPCAAPGRDRSRPYTAALFQLDARAGLFELGLDLLGLVLVDALLDGAGGAVDDVLGLLQAEARDRAHDLDHLDLLVARGGEDDVEGVLLLLGAAGG